MYSVHSEGLKASYICWVRDQHVSRERGTDRQKNLAICFCDSLQTETSKGGASPAWCRRRGWRQMWVSEGPKKCAEKALNQESRYLVLGPSAVTNYQLTGGTWKTCMASLGLLSFATEERVDYLKRSLPALTFCEVNDRPGPVTSNSHSVMAKNMVWRIKDSEPSLSTTFKSPFIWSEGKGSGERGKEWKSWPWIR